MRVHIPAVRATHPASVWTCNDASTGISRGRRDREHEDRRKEGRALLAAYFEYFWCLLDWNHAVTVRVRHCKCLLPVAEILILLVLNEGRVHLDCVVVHLQGFSCDTKAFSCASQPMIIKQSHTITEQPLRQHNTVVSSRQGSTVSVPLRTDGSDEEKGAFPCLLRCATYKAWRPSRSCSHDPTLSDSMMVAAF